MKISLKKTSREKSCVKTLVYRKNNFFSFEKRTSLYEKTHMPTISFRRKLCGKAHTKKIFLREKKSYLWVRGPEGSTGCRWRCRCRGSRHWLGFSSTRGEAAPSPGYYYLSRWKRGSSSRWRSSHWNMTNTRQNQPEVQAARFRRRGQSVFTRPVWFASWRPRWRSGCSCRRSWRRCQCRRSRWRHQAGSRRRWCQSRCSVCFFSSS